MKASSLLLDRLEFSHIHVVANLAYSNGVAKDFPQLAFSFKDVLFLRRSALDYPPSEAEDPRHFVFRVGIKLEPSSQKKEVVLPYDVEVEAVAYFRYTGDDMTGADRFRAVRASGYPMLYGAIREMIANLTARSQFGLWQMPSANFSRAAEQESKTDEESRVKDVERQKAMPVHATGKASGREKPAKRASKSRASTRNL